VSGLVLSPADLSPLRIGLSPLEMDAWLKPHPQDAPLLAARRFLAAEQPTEVLAALPAGEAPVAELAGILRARGLPLTNTEALPMLVALAGAVAEDLLVLTFDGAAYVLTAGVLCFPNRWRLVEKMGRSLTAIHGPVPDYESALASPVDRFLERLRPGRAFVRGNWGLASSPDLHLPRSVAPVDPTADDAFYLRKEEQCFVKLPDTEAVVFSIRTTVIPWAEVPEGERHAIREVAGLLSPEWRAYKSLK
jgi:hypothetical protein